jgi:formyl-CoA transferase
MRVVELAVDNAPGQLCCRLLADFGADVIKVEPPGGDPLRERDANWFAGLNTNKRSIAIDRADRTQRQHLEQLIDGAEVLLWDLDHDLGSSAEEIRAGRPSLVVTTITAFGCDGPRANWTGGDLVAAAAGGLAYITGEPDRSPLVPGGQQILHLAGVAAFSATLIAVFHARRHGGGQAVDVSMQEIAATLLESVITPLQIDGTVRGRMGTHHPKVHGVGMQKTADDRWVFVGTLPQLRMWETVKDLMDSPEWAQDPRWNDALVRRLHADQIDSLAAPIFRRMLVSDVYPQMKGGRVPVGLVRNMEELFAEDGQLSSREFFTTSPDDDGTTYPGPPWRMSATPGSLRLAPPPEPRLTTTATTTFFSKETK